ncbi:MAG: response regulator [Planctomicrobium sp.]|jgi:CheY-like chemotaxis protein|nr:response regulator [Planctomicrobium sp.]
MHILIVEDEELDVIALQRAFKKHQVHYKTTITRNGAEALAVLRGDDPEREVITDPVFILLDINMPRMNGLEFLKELRADSFLKRIPVFVLTTSDEQRDIQAAYRLGISGYTLKQKVGGDFEKLVALLNAYADLVVFPDG